MSTSLQRRIREIYEAENLQYGSDVTDEDDLVNRFNFAMQIRQKEIGRVMSEINRARTVDFCFLIDATGSMVHDIRGVRNSIHKIATTLSRQGMEKLRFAVVAYRDFDSGTPLETFAFNDSLIQCVQFCDRLRTFSCKSRDAAEDVFGGLEAAINLQWSPAASSRIIFHMADSPCHGRYFHGPEVSDNYPDGDPEGRLVENLFREMRIRSIRYFFGKITDSTDKMIQKFTEHYGDTITTFSVQEVADITNSVIDSVTETISRQVEATKTALRSGRVQRTFRLDPEKPRWSSIPERNGFFIVFELPSSIKSIVDDKDLIVKQVPSGKIKVAPQPFAEGTERLAYFGLDMSEDNDRSRHTRGTSRHRRSRSAYAEKFGEGPIPLVLKEYKLVAAKDLDRYKAANEIQTIASFLAQEFNRRNCGCVPIKFLKTKTLVIYCQGLENRPMAYEKEIINNTHTQYIKFTNNAGFSVEMECMKRGLDISLVDAVMAYSHWTHQVTGGFLMVVDLQGCVCHDYDEKKQPFKKVLMTDPAIHCLDLTRYRPLNMGRQGMQQFLRIHRCNRFCAALGLRAQTTR